MIKFIKRILLFKKLVKELTFVYVMCVDPKLIEPWESERISKLLCKAEKLL